MRLTIDARMMGAGKTRGIGRYVEELVRALLDVAPEHRYTLVVRGTEPSPFSGHPSVSHVVEDVPWYGVAEQKRMPSILARTRPDLVHIPHWNVPVLSQLPRVVTIHDLILLSEPRSTKASTRNPLTATLKHIGYRVALRSALVNSRRIFVPTDWVANEIRQRFPRLKTPIQVTGEGMPDVDATRFADSDAAHPYLLVVGGAYPHKNLDLLLDAWPALSVHHPTLSLVIVGERDVFMARLEARARTEGLPRVRFTGRIPDHELSRLYTRATALVFPSRNEGFGLPPLEALAHGCPVIASNATSMPEVLGTEGALFFEPSGTDGILRAIETALRNALGLLSHARAAASELRKRHDWHHTAEQTLEGYERAIKTR